MIMYSAKPSLVATHNVSTCGGTLKYRSIMSYSSCNRTLWGFVSFIGIVKNRWLHHTSFLWDYRDDRMTYLTVRGFTLGLVVVVERA